MIAPRITNGRNGVLNGRSRHTGNDRRSSHSFPSSRLRFEGPGDGREGGRGRGEKERRAQGTNGALCQKMPAGLRARFVPPPRSFLGRSLGFSCSDKSFPRAPIPRRMHSGGEGEGGGGSIKRARTPVST